MKFTNKIRLLLSSVVLLGFGGSAAVAVAESADNGGGLGLWKKHDRTHVVTFTQTLEQGEVAAGFPVWIDGQEVDSDTFNQILSARLPGHKKVFRISSVRTRNAMSMLDFPTEVQIDACDPSDGTFIRSFGNLLSYRTFVAGEFAEENHVIYPHGIGVTLNRSPQETICLRRVENPPNGNEIDVTIEVNGLLVSY